MQRKKKQMGHKGLTYIIYAVCVCLFSAGICGCAKTGEKQNPQADSVLAGSEIVTEEQDEAGIEQLQEEREESGEAAGEDRGAAKEKKQENMEKDPEPEMVYVTGEELQQIGGLSEEELENLDVEAFVKKYELTEETLVLYDLHQLVKTYRMKETEAYPDYAYLSYGAQEREGFSEAEVQQVCLVALVEKKDTYEKSRVIDLQKNLIYDGDGENLLEGSIDRYTPVNAMTAEMTDQVYDILESLAGKEENDFPVDEDSGANSSWRLYLQLDTEEIIYYGATEKLPEKLAMLFEI